MRKLMLWVCAFAAFGLAVPVSTSAAGDVQACQKSAALINYRSDLLVAYKKKEQDRYEAFRNRWAGRIQYASQWLSQDAEKARDGLYAYDALHKKTNAELDKQIKQYETYEKAPVGCNAADKKRLDAASADVRGKKTGNAAIRQLKDAETAYQRKEFKKITDDMIKKMHSTKKKHPVPLYASPIKIRDV
jgi:hypothetical protein